MMCAYCQFNLNVFYILQECWAVNESHSWPPKLKRQLNFQIHAARGGLEGLVSVRAGFLLLYEPGQQQLLRINAKILNFSSFPDIRGG